MRVLVVEDELKINRTVCQALREEAYAVDAAFDGDQGEELALVNEYDLIILDIMLPKKNGIMLCRGLREHEVAAPILMLTARDAVADRVAGLEAGADDYLVKPFAVPELVARLRALTRRGRATDSVLAYADLTLDVAARNAIRAGRAIELTGREAALLELLLRESGRTVTRDRALDEIWDDAAEPNVVDRYITRLRRKLGDPPLIRTLRGTGFQLRA